MDSSLRPRDIQARIRAGESPEDVARAAGVPLERIEAFAAPVVAERDHVAGLAQMHPVRRRGETTSHRTLRNAVSDALAARGIDSDAVVWDSWKVEDRRWRIRAAYPGATGAAEALFTFDQAGRFSVAADDEARALVGDVEPGAGEDDQFALVRATQAATPEAATPAPPAPADANDLEDAYREGELAEVDGVYEIVETPSSDLDVLYDMLSSFDEDSVKIYAGLIHPKEEAPDVGIVLDAPPTDEPPGTQEAPDRGPEEGAPHQDGPIEREPGAVTAAGEAEQETLVGEDPGAARTPRRPTRRKRAAVPSWDEIMFGSPRPEE